jgi:hypothetical protein
MSSESVIQPGDNTASPPPATPPLRRAFHRVFHRFFHWRRLRFAFGEVLMITIGIHLAFGLDRIGDYYQQRELEQRTLVELRNGIARDRLDIKINIKGYEGRMEAATLIQNYLDNRRLPDQQFNRSLNTLLETTNFVPSNVPFETLKTRGLDTIRNEQLRAEVAEYYEIHRAALLMVENRYNGEQAVYISPYVRKYLDVDNSNPAQLQEQMQQDREFRRELIWLGRYSRQMIKKYAAIDGHADVLIKRINDDVTKL